jgi:nitrate/nitrite transport system permease protein
MNAMTSPAVSTDAEDHDTNASQIVSKAQLAGDTNLSASARARVPSRWEQAIGNAALPLIGVGAVLLLWAAASATFAESLPSPSKTWEASRLYVLEPFAKRGELDQGILRFTWYSLQRVTKGYSLAIVIGAPLGFLLGTSKLFRGSFDPIIQILRPVSPLAWLPLGLVLFHKPEPAGIFTIAMCSMWPTVLNTALGVRAVPQDYLNVARVLKLSRAKTLFKVMLPAALPYMFTGFRLSLGIAWLVIVAAEMLTGAPGVGGFLWQEYNALIYEHIILCILTIGLVGFALDRLMGLVEKRLRAA